MEQISESQLRIWRGFSWLAVLALLSVGALWTLYLPTVGKGGIFLAVGATLMPLFWEKIGVGGKMSWIAMLFVLLAVEYRAIDKEHHDNDIAQQAELKAIGEGFNGVLTDQRNRFAELIQRSDDAFKKTTELASAQFNATMSKAQDNLNHMTGGSTFPVVTLVPVPLENSPNTFRLALSLSGNNPLFDVTVRLTKLPAPTTFNVTDFVSGKSTDNTIFSASSLSPRRAMMLPTVTVSPDEQSNFRSRR